MFRIGMFTEKYELFDQGISNSIEMIWTLVPELERFKRALMYKCSSSISRSTNTDIIWSWSSMKDCLAYDFGRNLTQPNFWTKWTLMSLSIWVLLETRRFSSHWEKKHSFILTVSKNTSTSVVWYLIKTVQWFLFLITVFFFLTLFTIFTSRWFCVESCFHYHSILRKSEFYVAENCTRD